MSPWFSASSNALPDIELEKHRRGQFAYLARYAPGMRIDDRVSLYELREWVSEISAIVKEEMATTKE